MSKRYPKYRRYFVLHKWGLKEFSHQRLKEQLKTSVSRYSSSKYPAKYPSFTTEVQFQIEVKCKKPHRSAEDEKMGLPAAERRQTFVNQTRRCLVPAVRADQQRQSAHHQLQERPAWGAWGRTTLAGGQEVTPPQFWCWARLSGPEARGALPACGQEQNGCRCVARVSVRAWPQLFQLGFQPGQAVNWGTCTARKQLSVSGVEL